jgi:type III secretion protein U
MSDEEKTEDPTDKKLRDVRDQGQTIKSPDVNGAAGLAALTVCLIYAGSLGGEHLLKLFATVDQRAWRITTNIEAQQLAIDLVLQGFFICLPFLLVSIVIGFIVSVAQTGGLLVSFDPITPDFEKLNPAEGLKRLFSLRSLVDFVKMAAKSVALVCVLAVIIIGLMPLLLGTSLQEPAAIVSVAWSAIVKLFFASTIVFIVIGPIDWGLQKWLFLRDQKMTKHEVKRENKEMEGDPDIKKKRKEIANEMINGLPQKRVPTATVVMTNPTHYAVALEYVPGRTPLPIIVAKGQGPEAALIRELAATHGIPIVSNPPLARALFRQPIDEPIPEELFEAVAAVLRWLNVLKKVGSGQPLAPARKH